MFAFFHGDGDFRGGSDLKSHTGAKELFSPTGNGFEAIPAKYSGVKTMAVRPDGGIRLGFSRVGSS